MKFCAIVIKAIGAIGLVAFVSLFSSLHGCAQRYGDKTQTAWLNKRPNSVYQTQLSPVAGQTADRYAGRIRAVVSGNLESPVIGELSGLAVSRLKPDVYWAINDSGNLPELFAIRPDGKHLASFNLPFENRDWEDLASFRDQSQSWLLVADSGDNVRKNKVSTLHFFHEPLLPQTRDSITNHRKVAITYEDGPQNVESVAVSVRERLIFLIAKNSGAPKVYVLPLDIGTHGTAAGQPAPVLARLVGRMKRLTWTEDDRWIEKKLASRILLGATAMDISADDSLAVVSNYRHVYLYRRQSSQTWLQALQTTPQNITTHRLAQSESVAFNDDAKMILIGSEGRFAPLLAVTSEVD